MSDDDPNQQGNSRRWIIREVEESLRRLKTDYIDLYQLHRPRPETDIDDTLSALSDLVHAGKVRYIGTTTFLPSQVVEAQWVAERRHRERPVTEQAPYSILAREVERDLLPTAQKYGLGVLPWSPLAGGWLSGRYRRGEASTYTSSRLERQPARHDPSLPENASSSRPCTSSRTSPTRPGSRWSTSRWRSCSSTPPSRPRSSARAPWSTSSRSSTWSRSRWPRTSWTGSTRSSRPAPRSTRPTAVTHRPPSPTWRCGGAPPVFGRFPARRRCGRTSFCA